ncbi:MAG TPA: glycosyltransferase, partial [Thermoanaerobaculia bacterium]|nr:glycosyltransferase [Thermoanaerobaculia bacterium]
MKIVVLGLSITSSWGNGHATTYRALLRELAANGHDILFLERELPWYRDNRDLTDPPYCTARIYHGLAQLKQRYGRHVREADLVIVGSYVPQGTEVGEWVISIATGLTAFYDIDTPVTLAKLARRDFEYLSPHLIKRYDLYFSFTGGPTLERIERQFGARMARALYCSFDPRQYFVESRRPRWDLGYLGTYSDDRQPSVERLLMHPARALPERKFVVAGPQYPESIAWPRNVRRITHLPPAEHRKFYNSQRFALNVTRAEMVRAGWSPSVRLFEAAACGVPIISDEWPGLESLFKPGREILIARQSDDVLEYLDMSDDERREIGARARLRVMREHTAAHRAAQLESYVTESGLARRPEPRRRPAEP